jgi:hypothetical protein
MRELMVGGRLSECQILIAPPAVVTLGGMAGIGGAEQPVGVAATL